MSPKRSHFSVIWLQKIESEGRRNNDIIMPSCKEADFMLRQV